MSVSPNLKIGKSMKELNLFIPKTLNPSSEVKKLMKDFLNTFSIYEIENGSSLILNYDHKSKAFYLMCHLTSIDLINYSDLEATLDIDNEEDVIYKLNREITEDQTAFKTMEDDAKEGRSFEDLVIEYDKTYRKEKPLKIYGGQHRVRAISNAEEQINKVNHGIRIYFDLNRNQKVEIATISNTSIAVPNDLLDRMREQLLGSELRDWCQNVGLLKPEQDFSDRKSFEVPTVRIARTLLINYFLGKETKLDDFHQPIVAKSGGDDEKYLEIRERINWRDPNLLRLGKEYAKLHTAQRRSVTERSDDNLSEYARKALSLAVASSWSYAVGLFQNYPELLKVLYNLPDSVSPPEDPLNAKALSAARLRGTDPDTYRGLGTRSNSTELGRMLEVFLVLCTKAQQKRITERLANAAIQSYEAKRAMQAANKAIGKI